VRLRVACLVVLLSACGWGSNATHTTAPLTAFGVVLRAGDVPGVQKCPQSDRWAGLMLRGEPDMLPTGFASWADLKAEGATDAWLSLYAGKVDECPLLLGFAPPTDRLVYSAVIQFKDAASAAASFALMSSQFPVAPNFAARFTAAGGSVVSGAGIGLGQNSSVATISLNGVPVFVAFWQNGGFEAVVYADNVPTGEGDAAADLMNGRIH
jgi:hypothetical protein